MADDRKNLDQSIQQYDSKYDEDVEKDRRRLDNKVNYDQFTKESELRGQKAAHLISRNRIWDKSLERNEKTVEESKAKIAELEAKNEQMRRAQKELNDAYVDDVRMAKEDIITQQKWDNFFELRSDERPS